MITIIHGEDTTKSRQIFITLREKAANPVTLEGEKLTITELVQAVAGEELFTTEKHIFIENLLTKKKSSKELDEMLTFIKTQTDQDLTFWEGKDVDKRTLNKLPTATLKYYPYPTVIFIFLDAIRPGNGANLVKQLREVTKTMEVEAVFFLLIRQIRLFLALYENGHDEIDEVKSMAPWQRTKVTKQAKLFSKEHLLSLHKNLYEIDLGQKTGTLPISISSTIDIFLLSI